ncbi:eukaryotic translation initiation factor 2-alpha kinase [Microbotryomycetes sp. JL221]|nr:eukaryotic translation initiation factor 2-alpha kinase [Microbotryomycetes sp. JL221]
MASEHKELQEGELEVLKSIFMEDFETVQTSTAWKSVNAVHEFRICVRSQEEDLRDIVSVRIHFKLPSAYPKKPPTMTFEDAKGLSQAHVAALRTSLQQAATSLLGAEMIYELCSNAAQFITDRHADTERGKQTSLEDQRRQRGQELEKATREAEIQAEALKAKMEAAEAARLSQLISQDLRRKEELQAELAKKEREMQSNGQVQFLQVGSDGQRQADIDVLVDGTGERTARVKFGAMSGGDWLGRRLPVELVLTVDMVLSGMAYVVDILAPHFMTTHGKRKVAKVQTDLDRVRRLRHPHLTVLYGYRLARFTSTFFPANPQSRLAVRSGDGWTLVIVSETSQGQSLKDLLTTVGEIKSDRALSYFTQIVAAVECLHSANIVHKAIRPRAITIGREGIKLGEASWFQRIVDLNKAEPWVHANTEDDCPEAWTCPEAVDDPFAYDRSRDMWDLGVVFAQMVFGLDVFRKFLSPADLVRSLARNAAPVLRKVFSDLLLTEAKKRTTVARLHAQLLESSNSISSQDTLIVPTTPKFNNGFHTTLKAGLETPLHSPAGQAELSQSLDKQVGFFWQPRSLGSRYRSEFEELEFLGRGGGGQVVKARNRLDGHLYAVKKIRLPHDRASENKILREVTIWSRMNHPNIVRYHTAWTETEGPSSFGGASDTDISTQPTETTDRRIATDNGDDTDSGPDEFDEDSASTRPADDLDIDLGLDDLDDLDFLSVGHSKSVSYPSIHFGNEGDPSTNGQNSPVLSKRGTASSKQMEPLQAQSPKQTRTLYIQMEYVEKLTLREAIDDGISEPDAWRLMYQILSAMLHFTSLNIIHRDLKPSNIFIDHKGDVRIGDFGLAVNQGAADPADVFLSVESSLDETELTSGVGTSLYIAPETLSRNKQGHRYSNKIDMYSLGITFFEMFHPPFKTAMERIQVLRGLREPSIKFPETWDTQRFARHTTIIRTCLVHDPERRAAPKDLLESDLLPPRVGDESIEETIRLLSHPGTPHAQTLINALFNNQTDDDRLRKDFSYDLWDSQGAKVDNDPYTEIVREKLSRIFRNKGAILLDSPLLMPSSEVYASRKPVKLLDSDGTIACLPFQLNIPFCRMVARDTSLTRMKRWTIAPVYRLAPAGGQPRAVLNAAFDIVSDAVTPAAEAESIYVVDEIMGAFPLPGETVHYLNHVKILEAILERLPQKYRAQALEVLVQHGRLQRAWSKTATELFKILGITREMCDELGALDCTGDVVSMRKRVLTSVPRLKHIVQEAFDELQDVIGVCRRLGIKNIKVAPLLATNWDFHRDGILFESHQVHGRTREIVAAGGRFDDVVLRLAAPDVRFSGRCPHVVGVSIAVAKLSQAAAEANSLATKAVSTRKDDLARNTYGPWAIRRCDVYVVSFVSTLIELRLEIVKDLWRAGIKADLMYDDDFLTLSPEQLVSACRREGIMWIVIVKPSATGAKHAAETIKIKSVLRGYEEEGESFARNELVSWLTKEMRESQATEDVTGEGTIETLLQHTETSKTQQQQDYIPVIADDDVRQKGRNKQKQMLISKAQRNVEMTAEAAASAPVFAVDIDGAAFRKMCESTAWVSDDEAFRQIIQLAPTAKRSYLTSIRQHVQRHMSRTVNASSTSTGNKSFWLFSLRDDKSVLMTLF